jgi:hypothetical protein
MPVQVSRGISKPQLGAEHRAVLFIGPDNLAEAHGSRTHLPHREGAEQRL